jgi:UDP-N-acetylglucosamine--N-acetylmuramyl-(pentapeptide) pyrophosphoryl-undecaprenol N-acetylglucosamine transferase
VKKIFYVAGKSGGHIEPLFTILSRAKSKHGRHYSVFITTTQKIDRKIIKQRKRYVDKHIALPLVSIPSGIRSVFDFITSILKVLILFRRYRPSCIYTTGGYISVPVSIIGFIFRVPIEIYHLDASLGKAGKLIGKIASKSHVLFDKTKDELKEKNVYLAKPLVRFRKNDIFSKEKAKDILGIPQDKFVILILGGSQGSEEINSVVIDCFAKLDKAFKENLFFMHQIGNKKICEIKKFYKKNKLKCMIFDYSSRMAPIYSASDIVISRGGSGTLFDLVFFKKNSFIIPLKNVANNHQVLNTIEMKKKYDFIKAILDENTSDISIQLLNELNNIDL